MAKEHAQTKLDPGLDAATVKALREAHWEAQLETELARTLHEYRAMFARRADQVGVHRDPYNDSELVEWGRPAKADGNFGLILPLFMKFPG
jgi:aspartyl/asparaginyl beta-hydroxylase (cupin superfamily)